MIEKNISDLMEGHEKVDLYIAIVDALSKQIPYRPKPCGLTTYKCLCGTIIVDKTLRHCGDCGQKLDWRQ